jgi:hypothetical protein
MDEKDSSSLSSRARFNEWIYGKEPDDIFEPETVVSLDSLLCPHCQRAGWTQSGVHSRKWTGQHLTKMPQPHSSSRSPQSCAFCDLLSSLEEGNDSQQVLTVITCNAAELFLRKGVLRFSTYKTTVLVPFGSSKRFPNWVVGITSPGKSWEEFAPRLVDPLSVDYNVVREWLRLCSQHPRSGCSTTRSMNLWGFRLIHCKSKRIVQAPHGCSYVTLSYVWGDSQDSPHLNETDGFPRTVSDSITVALALGFDYLWVDRYCIDQDNPLEKHHQISSMDQIYSEAALTIIAAAGKGPYYGLPGVGATARTPQRFAKIGEYIVAEVFPNIKASLRESTWSSRAWTLQEGFLSKRRLIFDEHQVSYVCGHGYRAESFIHEVAHHEVHPSLDLSDMFDMRHIRSGIGHFKLVEELVEEYTKRHLSHDSDAINACLGILNSWKRDKNGPVLSSGPIATHLWGIILRSSASLLLNWYHPEPALRRSEFPSWSWAGWKGPIQYLSTISDDVGKIEVKVFANEYEWKTPRQYIGRGLLDANDDVESTPRLLQLTGQVLSHKFIKTPPVVVRDLPETSRTCTYTLLPVTRDIYQVFQNYLDFDCLHLSDLSDCIVMAVLTSRLLPSERRLPRVPEIPVLPFHKALPASDSYERVSYYEKGHLAFFCLVLKPVGKNFRRVGVITSEAPVIPGRESLEEVFCDESGAKEMNLDADEHNRVFLKEKPTWLRTAATSSVVLE